MVQKSEDRPYSNQRNYIYALKAVAVICIVSVHCATVNKESIQLNQLFSWLLNQIGGIGVAVFLMISGYLFYGNKYPVDVFLQKRAKTILLPWFVTGTLVYLYVTVRKGGIGIGSWLNFLIGNGSYLYFLTMLMVLYAIFFFTSKNKAFVTGAMFVSGVSILLTSMGLLQNINHFLNPFNYIFYFGLGLIAARKDALGSIADQCAKYRLFIIPGYLAVLAVMASLNIAPSSGWWILVQPFAFAMAFSVATFPIIYKKPVIGLGIDSFGIYLLHMPIAGMIVFLSNRFNLWQLTLLRPLIVVAITLTLIYIYKFLGKKLGTESVTNSLVGIR